MKDSALWGSRHVPSGIACLEVRARVYFHLIEIVVFLDLLCDWLVFELPADASTSV